MTMKHLGRGVMIFLLGTAALYLLTFCVDGIDSPRVAGEVPLCVLGIMLIFCGMFMTVAKLFKRWERDDAKHDA